jgi:hypothetical protein
LRYQRHRLAYEALMPAVAARTFVRVARHSLEA